MPFTAAHPAAVLYLQRLPWRLSGIALVAGSIAPDLEFYLRLRAHAVATDSLWIQLLIGFLLCLAWQWQWRRICTALLPSALAVRFGIAAPAQFLQAAIRKPGSHLLALLIGIFSHWAWDSFTHHDGACIAWFPALAEQWPIPFTENPVRVYFLLQVLSSIFGIAVVLLYRHAPENAVAGFSPVLPSRTEKLRTRCLFILSWAFILLFSSFFLPEARFVWDNVFHALGAGLYAFLLLALVMGIADGILRGKAAGSGYPEEESKA